MSPTHERDGAERTPVVTSFADLEIAHVRQLAREETNARMQHRSFVDETARLKRRNELIHLRGAEEEIDLRQLVEELLFVTLHHAADTNDGATGSLVLQAPCFDQRVDGFLFRGVDETARVDDDHLGLREIVRVLGAVIGELSDVSLAVDRVLIAAQGDDRELQESSTVVAKLQLDPEVLASQELDGG